MRDVTSAFCNGSAFTPLQEQSGSRSFTDLNAHLPAPEYFRSSSDGVVHFVYDKEKHALRNCQEAFRWVSQSSGVSPMFGQAACKKYTYECNGVWMCHGASDEFKNMQYEDGMSSTYPQCPKAHARKELLHFLLDTQNTECKVPSCHGQRLVLRRAQATYEVVLCSEFDLQFLTPNVTNQYDHVVFRIPSRCEKITSLMSNASSSSSGGRISVQQVLRTIHTQGQFCDSLYSPSRVPRSLNCYRHTPAIPPEERAM